MREAEVLPLDGTVKLVVTRYLHLHADLHYTTEVRWRDGEDRDGEGSGTPSENAHIETAAATESTTHMTRGPDGRPLLSYGFHFDEENDRMTVVALHPDAASVELHMEVGASAFSRFGEFIEMDVTGDYLVPGVGDTD
jgi:hypothetical protein